MNIVVVGAGGVGGYFGAKLTHAGCEVTFIARGKHLEAIRANGLLVKSIHGDFKVHPKVTDDITTIKNADVIILGIKSWQIDAFAKLMQPYVQNHTMVLPLQNGADIDERLSSIINPKNVLAGLCRIVSKVEQPGVINHFAFEPEIIFSEVDNSETERVKELQTLFEKAGIKSKISEHIHLDIWRKFLFINMVSGIGAITRVVFGKLKDDKAIRSMILETGHEILTIANAKKIPLSSADLDKAMKAFDATDFNTTASMQRDIMKGLPSELEDFHGHIVKLGRELHITTPMNSWIYHCLLPQELQARNSN